MSTNSKRDVSGDSCKYKYIYITTLQNSSLFYVGRHSSNKNPNVDNYRGSGKWIKSIKDKSKLCLEPLAYYNTFTDLELAEQQLIDLHINNPNCMNFNKVASGCGSGELNHQFGKIGKLSVNYGNKHILQSKQKMSIAIKKHYMLNLMTQEHKNNISLSKQGQGKGVPRTEKTRLKIGMSQKGKKLTPEHIELLRKNATGKKKSTETKLKLSLSHKGKQLGSSNPNSKLSEKQVVEIKRLLIKGCSGASLARLYAVSTSVISEIKTGKSWGHIEVLV